MSELRSVINENDVSCPICREEMKRPTSLNCQHTFCLDCLKSLHRSTGRLQCPNCREMTPKLPEQLPQNLAMVKLIEARRMLRARRVASKLPTVEELQQVREQSSEAAREAKEKLDRVQRCLSDVESKLLQAVAAQWDRAENSLGSLVRHHEQRARWAAEAEQVRRAAEQTTDGPLPSLAKPEAPTEPTVESLTLRDDGELFAAELAAQFAAELSKLLSPPATAAAAADASSTSKQAKEAPDADSSIQQPGDQQQPQSQRRPERVKRVLVLKYKPRLD